MNLFWIVVASAAGIVAVIGLSLIVQGVLAAGDKSDDGHHFI